MIRVESESVTQESEAIALPERADLIAVAGDLDTLEAVRFVMKAGKVVRPALSPV